jgi:hypothetical protein
MDTNIIGRYYLKNEEEEKYILNYKVNEDGDYLILVDLYVYSVGFDSSYIIVKQHPKYFEKESENTNYYILPVYKTFTYSPKDGIIGPLSSDEFNKKRIELSISHIRFTLH